MEKSERQFNQMVINIQKPKLDSVYLQKRWKRRLTSSGKGSYKVIMEYLQNGK